jgi:hypothetical protein
MTTAARFAWVVYCDDIRHEISNKQSFIGVYASIMYVPHFPITLPRLCIAVNVVTRSANPFKRLNFKILMDDSVLVEAPLDEAQVLAPQKAAPNTTEADNDILNMFGARFELSPLQVNAPTKIRVRIETEDEELKGNALSIALAPTIRQEGDSVA